MPISSREDFVNGLLWRYLETGLIPEGAVVK